MGKKKKSSGDRSGSRTRINPLTGEAETVTGTRSRTHDLKPAGSKQKRHQELMNRGKQD
jgi:hypothetical protein